MVNWLNEKLRLRVKDILFGIFLAAACICVQHSSQILSVLASYPVNFIPQDTTLHFWTADVSHLKSGQYYVSVGSPRSNCEVYKDEIKLDSNRSDIPGLRNSLFLGGGFLVSAENPAHTINIKCAEQPGFNGFTHKPVITDYNSGVILQTWREVTELLIGPLSSLIILFSVLFRQRQGKETGPFPFEGWRYQFFALVSFLYALSLSLYTRLFLAGLTASVTHIVLRCAFSLAVLILFTTVGKKQNIVLGAHFIYLGVLGFFAVFSPERLTQYYEYEYLFFPIASTIMALILFSEEPSRKSGILLRQILFAWTITQFLDGLLLWTGSGGYSGPSLILLLSASAFYLRFLERRETAGIDLAVSKILSVVESDAPIEKVLEEVANITREETKYGRVSAYVDGFCLGAADSPGQSFYRVFQTGYKKDTSRDSVISFSENRGGLMQAAVQSRQPFLALGKETGAWFMIVPIGVHATLNLSDDHAKSNFLAYESREIIRRIFLSLLSLERRLIDLGFLQGAALQKLRSKRGDGVWEEEFGAIFVDINDYSQLADAYGDSFTKFISNTYIPSCIKAVAKSAVSEHIAGDEIYFIVISDLLAKGVSIRQGVIDSLSAIDEFVANEGAALCAGAGFSPLSASIGISIGSGSIVCDTVSVRTTGKIVNHAKRLQEEAGKGGILIARSAQLTFDGSNYIVGEETVVCRKKQVILAQKILRRTRGGQVRRIAS